MLLLASVPRDLRRRPADHPRSRVLLVCRAQAGPAVPGYRCCFCFDTRSKSLSVLAKHIVSPMPRAWSASSRAVGRLAQGLRHAAEAPARGHPASGQAWPTAACKTHSSAAVQVSDHGSYLAEPGMQCPYCGEPCQRHLLGDHFRAGCSQVGQVSIPLVLRRRTSTQDLDRDGRYPVLQQARPTVLPLWPKHPLAVMRAQSCTC